MAERVLVGAIAGAHGVRGQLRIKLIVIGQAKGGVIARIDGIADRTAAEALRGLRLYVDRAVLPPPESGEYYRVDLIGLRAELADGSLYGSIASVEDYGAGDILEIARPDGTMELLPFSDRTVPVVDLAAGRAVVDPPVYIEAR